MASAPADAISSIGIAAPQSQSRFQRALAPMGRYAMSAFGPISVSGAHFLASLIFLHSFTPADFGTFSFLLVAASFCLNMSGSMLGAPIATTLSRGEKIAGSELATYMKANLVLSVLAGIAVFGLMLASKAAVEIAVILGAYGMVMALRWFARSYAYVAHRAPRVVLSDVAYSGLLVAGLFALDLSGALSVVNVAFVLLAASVAGVFAFEPGYIEMQIRSIVTGSLRAYAPIWRDITRWSLMGVVLSEITANAHAYLVTFFSGPHAFALLALGSLLMRPISLVLAALPDMERPRLARYIGQGDMAGVSKTVKEFRTVASAVWVCSILLAAAIVIWFPQVLFAKGYDGSQANTAIMIWFAIMGVRTLYTPSATLLQSAAQFKPLANAGTLSSIAALGATAILLVAFGPVASLGGILIGDLVLSQRIFALSKAWRKANG